MTLSHTQGKTVIQFLPRRRGQVTASAYGNIPFLFGEFFSGNPLLDGFIQGDVDTLSDDSISIPSQNGEDTLVISAANARLFAAAGNGDVTAPEFRHRRGGLHCGRGGMR